MAILDLAKNLFGSANDRVVKRIAARVPDINALEPDFEALPDDALRAKTDEYRQRLAAGETLDDILPEAFATVREAAKRTLGQRHFDVQLIGGMVLHRGAISEMKTGEGKTLVATLAAYLNAIEGKGVHVVTVNDYLAKRDSEWMGQIYGFLGLTVGCIVHGLSEKERRDAYGADITYGTNNEFGFDYLRDNMKFSLQAMVQRPFNFAIVDEVDSILIDEARTPLIISGPTEDNSELYRTIDKFIPQLAPEHWEKDEKSKTVSLTEDGTEFMEDLLRKAGHMKGESLYDIGNVTTVHHVTQALRAHTLFERDVDYIVKDDQVIIIDEFTGRMMPGRRYSEGLHQALEAKEKVTIQNENQTLASITFQNYFRLYPKLAGMTGTAMTEADELADIYGLGVVDIPTNKPVARADEDDEVYRTVEEKYDAIVEEIKDCQKRGQPVLVGTVSIEKSEALAARLKKAKVDHQVLNARYHEQEAFIIAQAGAPGAVTIATNMAGRGTDIQLGGNLDMKIAEIEREVSDDRKRERQIDEIKAQIARDRKRVLEAGGLFVLGTERHESRRIDNQLRGRSGRQGDPGRSKFYLSLEDDLMRIFGSERLDSMLVKLGLEEGEAIVHPWINRAIEKAQSRVEQRNFEVRKNLLKFDNVMNDQRKVIYEQRKELLEAESVADTVEEMRHDVIESLVDRHIPQRSLPEQWDINGLTTEYHRIFGLEEAIQQWVDDDGITEVEITEKLTAAADARMAARNVDFGMQLARRLEKTLLLDVLDQHWKDHLLQLDHLRQTVGLRAYAQRDPLNEYKAEAFSMFQDMLARVRDDVTYMLAHVEVRSTEAVNEFAEKEPSPQMQEHHTNPLTGEDEMAALASAQPVRRNVSADDINPNDPRTWGKVQRNAACPCGSGKKYKHCHGQTA